MIHLSADGQFLTMGVPGIYWTADIPGYVNFYKRGGAVGQTFSGNAKGDEFGWYVALSGDWQTTLSVGAWSNNQNGSNSGQVQVSK